MREKEKVENAGRAASISLQTFKRLPSYYAFLRSLYEDKIDYVAAPAIAHELGLNEVQVRKDLAAVSHAPGKPRKGFEVEALLASISECLGYQNRSDAVLVGAGQLGKALLAYQGFEEQGVRIVAAFDEDETLAGTSVGGKMVFPMSRLAAICQRMQVQVGIITAPAACAQEVCDKLVECGVLAIWNFAPTHLKVPPEVLVQNENMAASLALLSQHLADTIQPKRGKEK